MKIAILGAGIGGLTLAQSLARNGQEFDLYEASDAILPVGAGIWMPPNAMQVLNVLGKAESVTQIGIALETMHLLDLNARSLGQIAGGKLSSLYQFPTVSIKRSDLHSILFRDLPPSSIHLGHQCQDISVHQNKTTLSFQNGKRAEYDLVIAADGIHSLARKKINPSSLLRYSGQSCFRAITTLNIPLELKNQSFEIWGHGARFGCSPVGANEVYWYAPFSTPAGQAFSPSERFDLIKTVYAKFPSVAQSIIQAITPESIIHTDLFEVTPTNTWSIPGLILLGDAAHSMTPNLGQGAAMAIEDAFLLGSLLKQNNFNLAHLGETYFSQRAKRVNLIAHWSRQLGSLGGWKNPFFCNLRDFILKNTPDRIQRKQIDYIYKSCAHRK